MYESYWMSNLAAHYDNTRRQFSEKHLIILFDIDGTIIDMRIPMVFLLKEYDLKHETNHFDSLEVGDTDIHENHIALLLDNYEINGKGKIILSGGTGIISGPGIHSSDHTDRVRGVLKS